MPPRRRLLADAALLLLWVGAATIGVGAQSAATTGLAIFQAEERGASTARDLPTIRNATRGGNTDTVRAAVRALGRLQLPSQIPYLLPLLKHSLPEVRVEAANALAQAAQGFLTLRTPTAFTTVGTTQSALIARLAVEADSTVRAALSEAIARLPYRVPADVERAEKTIVDLAAGSDANSVQDRLGMAKGLEALARVHKSIRPAGPAAIALLRTLVLENGARSDSALLRDARVRRLALEALTSADALDDEVVAKAATDPDAQVRRLAMRAAAISGAGLSIVSGRLSDPAGLVRVEALRALRSRNAPDSCAAAAKASSDADIAVALVAIDQLDTCGDSPEALAVLDREVSDRAQLTSARGWHRSAHALFVLAIAAPARAAAALDPYAVSPIWQVRMYAARAATLASKEPKSRAVLEILAADPDERVANTALSALKSPPRTPKTRSEPPADPPTAAEFRRLASPSAVVTIRGVGRFELALLTSEAPGTVLRFVQLAESGYYDGLTFDRIAPNAIVQGGRKLDGSARYPHGEIGTWPNVRGTVGLSAPDTNDAQFFINLVDNPRFDHQYTVFAQILNGADIVDDILEGDVIESIVIVP